MRFHYPAIRIMRHGKHRLRLWVSLLGGILVVGAMGCASDGDPTGVSGRDGGDAGGAVPVAVSTIEILNNEATTPDPNADATCQTGATCRLRTFNAANTDERTFDPQGQPMTYTWTDLADVGAGFEMTADWGPGYNPFITQDADIGVVLSTIGLHNITLNVRTRDGREASSTLIVRVTTCEDCGG